MNASVTSWSADARGRRSSRGPRRRRPRRPPGPAGPPRRPVGLGQVGLLGRHVDLEVLDLAGDLSELCASRASTSPDTSDWRSRTSSRCSVGSCWADEGTATPSEVTRPTTATSTPRVRTCADGSTAWSPPSSTTCGLRGYAPAVSGPRKVTNNHRGVITTRSVRASPADGGAPDAGTIRRSPTSARARWAGCRGRRSRRWPATSRGTSRRSSRLAPTGALEVDGQALLVHRRAGRAVGGLQ